MIRFETIIKKFDKQGEKTGWTYIHIPSGIAQQLYPGNKKSFRVKGTFDAFEFDEMAMLPMGEGDFIIALKADVRKAIKKRAGDQLSVQLSFQPKVYEPAADFMTCLEDEPLALTHFNTLTGSHWNYFSKWIESAKTEDTRTKRIVLAVNALVRKMGYADMIQEQTAKNQLLR